MIVRNDNAGVVISNRFFEEFCHAHRIGSCNRLFDEVPAGYTRGLGSVYSNWVRVLCTLVPMHNNCYYAFASDTSVQPYLKCSR